MYVDYFISLQIRRKMNFGCIILIALMYMVTGCAFPGDTSVNLEGNIVDENNNAYNECTLDIIQGRSILSTDIVSGHFKISPVVGGLTFQQLYILIKCSGTQNYSKFKMPEWPGDFMKLPQFNGYF